MHGGRKSCTDRRLELDGTRWVGSGGVPTSRFSDGNSPSSLAKEAYRCSS